MKQPDRGGEAKNAKLLEAAELLLNESEADKVHSVFVNNIHKVSVYSLSPIEDQTRAGLLAACERILTAYLVELGRQGGSRSSAEIKKAFDKIEMLCRQLKVQVSGLSDDEYRALLGSGYLEGSAERTRINSLIDEIGWVELRPGSLPKIPGGSPMPMGIRLAEKIEKLGEIAKLAHAYMESYNETRPKTFLNAVTERPDHKLIAWAGDLFSQLNIQIPTSRNSTFEQFLWLIKAAAGIDNPDQKSLSNSIHSYLQQRDECAIALHKLQFSLRKNEFDSVEMVAVFLDRINKGDDGKLAARVGSQPVEDAKALIGHIKIVYGER